MNGLVYRRSDLPADGGTNWQMGRKGGKQKGGTSARSSRGSGLIRWMRFWKVVRGAGWMENSSELNYDKIKQLKFVNKVELRPASNFHPVSSCKFDRK